MENKSHALAAGAFMLTLAVLLVTLALWLTRDQRQYVHYELSTADAISGLQTQATVRYKGVAVGKVTHIGFDDLHPGQVLIRIAVDENAPLSPSTYAQLGYQGVTGIAHIQLDDSHGPSPRPAPGNSGMQRLPMESSPLTVLADQGMLILSKADEAANRINQLLGDDNQLRFAQALEHLNQTMLEVQQVSKSLNHSLQQRLNPALATVPALAADSQRALQALAQTSAQVGQLTHKLEAELLAPEGLMTQLHTTSANLAQIAQRFDQYTLPGVQRASSDLSLATRQMGRTMANIDANPQSLIYGSGALRPGPGEPGFVAP
ncbi:MAG: MCE family protein [Comamonas sp.]|nr:MCE family protein [Comamonas sp.]